MIIKVSTRRRGDYYVPVFNCVEEGDDCVGDVPSVPMNRKGNGCFTNIDNLQEHNDDAPGFNSKSGVVDYINRVREAVDAAVREVNEREESN